MTKAPAEIDPRIEDLPNIGPTVAKVLRGVGIRFRSDLERLGSVGVYREVSTFLGHRPPRRYYLHGIEAALLGLPVANLPPRRRVALARLVLDLPAGSEAREIRPKNVIRARRFR